jgi:hypothetical protein
VFKGKILEKEMLISFNKTRGHFGLQRTASSFQLVTRMFLAVRRGVMNDPLKLFDESENL